MEIWLITRVLETRPSWYARMIGVNFSFIHFPHWILPSRTNIKAKCVPKVLNVVFRLKKGSLPPETETACYNQLQKSEEFPG